jgi:DNA-binding CsgD family transcriptional regulator
MAFHETILRIVERFYAAALDDGGWQAAVGDVVAVTGSRSACVAVRDMRQGRFVAEVMVNWDHVDVDKARAEYHGHYTRFDPQVAFMRATPGARLFHEGLDPRFAPEANPQFASWEESRLGLNYHLTGFSDISQTLKLGLSLGRSAPQGPAQGVEIELFSALWPHLEKAWHVAARLGALDRGWQVTLAGLETARHGVLLLDRFGLLIFANAAADRMLREGDGLAAKDGVLRVGLPELNRRFHRMVAAAAARRLNAPEATQAYLRAPRPSGRGRPYVLFVAPCPASERLIAAFRPAVIVLISDPELKFAPAAQAVRTAFGLSEREAALAVRLCLGDKLDEAARRLGMSRETARTLLARAFAKTGTRRQHALVGLLLGTLSGLSA